jgi:hypothetical protein
MRFKTEVARNSLNLYWQRLQDRLMDVVRLLVGLVTACLALELGWDDPDSSWQA